MLNKTNSNIKKYNCRSKRNCLLNHECLTQCLVYKATSKTSNNSLVYYEISKGEFKTQYNNYTNSFRHCQCISEIKLSKNVWNLKDHGLIAILGDPKKGLTIAMWLKMLQSVFVGKSFIICADRDTLLNKRTELIFKCCHRNKVLLVNVKKKFLSYAF